MAGRQSKGAKGRRSRLPDEQATKAAIKVTRGGRSRMQVLVNRTLLQKAAKASGAASNSDTIEIALRNLTENGAILAGIDAAIGMAPGFPYID